MSEIVKMLAERRSVVANALTGPGPTDEQLGKILTIGARVPDHGKLAPWRFVVFTNEAREDFGKALARLYKIRDPEASEDRLSLEKGRLSRAPVVICVISSPKPNPKIPEWEQILSSGAVCQNILLAATGLGFSAQWITEWYAYDEEVAGLLGLEPGEKVSGFIYIGTAREQPSERARPDMQDITRYWEK